MQAIIYLASIVSIAYSLSIAYNGPLINLQTLATIYCNQCQDNTLTGNVQAYLQCHASAGYSHFPGLVDQARQNGGHCVSNLVDIISEGDSNVARIASYTECLDKLGNIKQTLSKCYNIEASACNATNPIETMSLRLFCHIFIVPTISIFGI